MKKILMIVFGPALLLSLYPGTSGSVTKVSSVQRAVCASNMFYSTNNPKVMIKIDPSMPFLSLKEDSELLDHGLESKSTTRMMSSSYSFWSRKRNLVLTIAEILDDSVIFNRSPNFEHLEGIIRTGKEQLIGKTYFVGLILNKGRGIHRLEKIFGRFEEPNTLFTLQYYEWLHENWLDTKNLTQDQKHYLNKFNRRANNSFQAIEFEEKILLDEKPQNEGPYFVEVPADLRTRPNHMGNSLGRIKEGTEVDVLGRKGNFLLIKTPLGLYGYVLKDYVYALDKNGNQKEVIVLDQQSILEGTTFISSEEIERLPGNIKLK